MSFKLVDDPRVIIYDRNRVIIQATGEVGPVSAENGKKKLKNEFVPTSVSNLAGVPAKT